MVGVVDWLEFFVFLVGEVYVGFDDVFVFVVDVG